jgi:hypothetical protein
MMKYLFALMLLYGPWLVSAQRYRGEAPLPAVESNGYRIIAIEPSLSKFFTADFANLRITDVNGAEIPYVVETAREYRFSEFEEYHVEEKVQLEKCCTRLVFSNPTGQGISHIHLKVRNADVYKKAMIQGSDDNRTWYGVKDWFTMNRFANPSSPIEFRVVDFPLVDYKFLRMTISDSVTAPLNIESVGFYRDSVAVQKYNSINDAVVSIKNYTSQKETRITIKMDTLQWVDQLKIGPTGVPLFQRNATVYNISYVKNKKGRLVRNEEYLGEGILSNDSTTAIPLVDVHARELLIVVENGDSPPLRFETIQALQLARTVIAYLEKDKRYFIKIGSQETQQPVYDLALLRSKINGVLPVIEPGDVMIEKIPTDPGTRTFFSSAYMWAAIAGIIILLGFLSVKMIREIK